MPNLAQGFSQYYRFTSTKTDGTVSVVGASFQSDHTDRVRVRARPNDPDGTAFPDQFRVDAVGSIGAIARVVVACNGRNAFLDFSVTGVDNSSTTIIGAVGDSFLTPAD